KRLTEGKAQSRGAVKVSLQPFCFAGGIEPHVFLGSREIHQASAVFVEGHAVADLFLGLWRRAFDHFAQPAQVRLRRPRRSRDVSVDRSLSGLIAHCFLYVRSTSSCFRPRVTSPPSSFPGAPRGARSIRWLLPPCRTPPSRRGRRRTGIPGSPVAWSCCRPARTS